MARMSTKKNNIAMAALGCVDFHIDLRRHPPLHHDMSQPLNILKAAALAAGYDLAIASGYRGFDRQQLIWDAKLSGKRPVYDDLGNPLDLKALSDLEGIQKVLRWSALPGTSRHHWGCDVDIYDRAAISDDYQLRLIPEEYQNGGPFEPMMQWLQDYLQSPAAPDFFFPYTEDKGGVMPEPWHMSYRPIAKGLQQQWSLDLLCEQWQERDIIGKAPVLDNIEQLYEHFIRDSIYA